MSSDNFNFSIDALPVSAPAKPSSLETSAKRSDSTESGFRDVLSGSMDETRKARRTERRDEAQAPREAAAQKRSTVDHSKEQPRQRPETDADTKRAKGHNVSADAQISNEPTDHAEAVTDTNEQPAVPVHAAEGTPPAEFVAAMLAIQSTTSTADSEAAASSFETATITIQSPPQGLVTALAATNNEPANSELTKIQKTDGLPGLEAAMDETVAIDQPVNPTAADGQPVESSVPVVENPTASVVIDTTPASESVASTPTESRPLSETQPSVSPPTSEPQVPAGESTESIVQETGEPPVSQKNSPQQPAETSKTAQQQSIVENTSGVATADEGTDPQPVPPPTTSVGSSSKNSETSDTVSSDKAGPQQPMDTALDGQQSQNGSSDDQSQRQSTNSASFADSLTKTGEAASLQSPLVPVDDSATVRESTESVLGGPAPISQQSDVSRTVGTTTTVESAVDVERPDFAMRVANAVRTSADNRQQVTMRLTPPELGALRIEVAVEHGKVSARIDAQSSAAQKILLDSLPQLKEALVQNGASVERIEVMLADNSPNDQGGALGEGFTEQGERGYAPRDQSTYGDDVRGLAEAEETLETAAPAAKGITRNRGILEIDVTI